MAVIWSKSNDGWGAQRLNGDPLDLTAASVRAATETANAATNQKTARLMSAYASGAPVWALIAPAGSDLRVNGRPAHAGLCVLADRDEIRMGGEARYFSTETLAEVVPFPGAERPIFCGRCRQPILPGTPSVCCPGPGCQVWYHQDPSESLPCWAYAETCAYCPQPTALDTGFTWFPEED
jgi:hypothetical protein